jgi:hypothetical protein
MAQSKTKSNTNALTKRVKRSVAFLTGPGRWAAIGGLIVALFFAGWYLVWRQVAGRVLASREYLVGPQEVDITPLPSWIHTDIRRDVFGNASLDGPLSIMDDSLTDRIATAFSLHPWIAKVRRVTKHHPARVTVELEYRRPVLMVEVAGGLLPVDVQGVLLPSGDFSPIEKSRFPRLVGVNTSPLATAGERWGDARVVGAAEIAAALGSAWEELKLDAIVPSASPSGAPDDYLYALYTRGRTQIIWGRSPGSRAAGELPAAEKLGRLKEYVASHGTLEGPAGPQQLDVRNQRLSARPLR